MNSLPLAQTTPDTFTGLGPVTDLSHAATDTTRLRVQLRKPETGVPLDALAELAQFMVKTSVRYQTLLVAQDALEFFSGNPNDEESPERIAFQKKFDAFQDSDIRAINEYIGRIGGQIPVDYVDRTDQERMLGNFTYCRKYGKDGAWVMGFKDEQKYRQGINVTIFTDQLPGAMKLV